MGCDKEKRLKALDDLSRLDQELGLDSIERSKNFTKEENMETENRTTFLNAIMTMLGFHQDIDFRPQEDEVRERAYVIWEEAGRPESDGVEFWLKAEQELSGA
jgi:hypothetical protein